ncbi:MAG: hypothetical protein M1825_004780 [Sarcosagium campestre]|nr:MAG: hypothetical protein M1825_004780 [Sarcosagium campestre]
MDSASQQHARTISASDDQANAALQILADVDLPHHEHRSSSGNEAIPAIPHTRRDQSLKEKTMDTDIFLDDLKDMSEAQQAADTILYLAYGSNMCARTFQGVRGIKPISQLNVVVPEITLTFDLPGIPYTEPCFANVAFRKHDQSYGDVGSVAAIHGVSEVSPFLEDRSRREKPGNRWTKGLVGVVYEVTRKDYATIIATEGGGSSYTDILTHCYPLTNSPTVPEQPNSKPFKAHTLFSPARSDEEYADASSILKGPRLHRPDPDYAQASARYLKLLTDGAEEHDLPEEYQAYLRGLHPYEITKTKQRIGQFVFLAVWAPAIMTVVSLGRLFADTHGRSPRWLVGFSGSTFRALWTSYDRFFKLVFGDGERTIGDEYDGGELTDIASKWSAKGGSAATEHGTSYGTDA